MDFSGSMTLFLEMTRTKSLDLAIHLGYDNTYISKWSNGKRLPSKPSVANTLERMSEFFAQEIADKQLYERLQRVYPLHFDRDYESVQKIILSFLQEGYRKSEEQRIREKNKDVEPYARNGTIISGRREILEFFLQELYKHIALARNDVSLYATLNLFDILDINELRALRMHLEYNISLRLNILVDAERLQMAGAKQLLDMAMFFARAPFIRAELFEKLDEMPDCIVVDNRFAVLLVGSMDNPILVYTDDPEVVADFSSKIEQWFRKSFVSHWPQVSGPQDALFYDYRGMTAQVFTPRVLPFFLTHRQIDNAHNLSLETREIVTERQVAQRKLTEYVTVRVLMSLQGIANFLQTGAIYFPEGPVVLPLEERLDYLSQLLTPTDRYQITIIPLSAEFMRPLYVGSDVWLLGDRILFDRFVPTTHPEKATIGAVLRQTFGGGFREVQERVATLSQFGDNQDIVDKLRCTIDAYRELSVMECIKQLNIQIQTFDTINPLLSLDV